MSDNESSRERLKQPLSDGGDDIDERDTIDDMSGKSMLISDLHEQGIAMPRAQDVMCCDEDTNSHQGNVWYRKIVQSNLKWYSKCTEPLQILLSRSVVEAIGSQSPPGRFLVKDQNNDLWYDIGYRKAVERTLETFMGAAIQAQAKNAQLSNAEMQSHSLSATRRHQNDESDEEYVTGDIDEKDNDACESSLTRNPIERRAAKRRRRSQDFSDLEETPPTILDAVIASKLAAFHRPARQRRASE